MHGRNFHHGDLYMHCWNFIPQNISIMGWTKYICPAKFSVVQCMHHIGINDYKLSLQLVNSVSQDAYPGMWTIYSTHSHQKEWTIMNLETHWYMQYYTFIIVIRYSGDVCPYYVIITPPLNSLYHNNIIIAIARHFCLEKIFTNFTACSSLAK